MSATGSNYGGPNATITSVFRIQIKCEACREFVINHIGKTKGVQSATKSGPNQRTVVQKLNPLKIRNNPNFFKCRSMTALMGLNIDSPAIERRMENIIRSTEGFRDMSFDKMTKLVQVRGTIAINNLADKLARKLGKVVKIIDLKIDGGRHGELHLSESPQDAHSPIAGYWGDSDIIEILISANK